MRGNGRIADAAAEFVGQGDERIGSEDGKGPWEVLSVDVSRQIARRDIGFHTEADKYKRRGIEAGSGFTDLIHLRPAVRTPGRHRLHKHGLPGKVAQRE